MFGTVHVVHRLIKLPLTLKKKQPRVITCSPDQHLVSSVLFTSKFFFLFLNSENQNCNASTVSQLASVRKVKNKSSPGENIAGNYTQKKGRRNCSSKPKREGKDSGLPRPRRKKTLPAGQLESVMACKGESVASEKRGKWKHQYSS